jgi:hypothetical protein
MPRPGVKVRDDAVVCALGEPPPDAETGEESIWIESVRLVPFAGVVAVGFVRAGVIPMPLVMVESTKPADCSAYGMLGVAGLLAALLENAELWRMAVDTLGPGAGELATDGLALLFMPDEGAAP